MSCRAWLQESIIAHGGDYRSDLTKDVTHLIANAPEGRKYQYAERRNIRVVSLCWFKDCLDRDLVMDESLYHPFEEQEKARNREAKAKALLGKRPRHENPTQEALRKRQRTCSDAPQGAPCDSYLQKDLFINELPPDFNLELSQPEKPDSKKKKEKVLYWSWKIDYDISAFGGVRTTLFKVLLTMAQTIVRFRVDYQNRVAIDGCEYDCCPSHVDKEAQGWRIKLRRCMDNLELEVLVEWTVEHLCQRQTTSRQHSRQL